MYHDPSETRTLSDQLMGYQMTRTPDYIIKGLDKTSEARGKIGAGWLNENQSITIVFEPFIDGKLLTSKTFLITLFPKGTDK